LLSSVKSRWWIAGGWALDLFVGTETRAHQDLDVGILRRDVPQVLESMAGWEFFAAHGGQLQRLERPQAPGLEVHSLWGRPVAGTQWALELMLDESEGDSWVFRRERGIRLPLAALTARTPEGIPHLAPEIQLLYKAKGVRPKDEADFRRVLPRLDVHARSWLLDALARIDARHEWLAALAP
jgi:hypothetical protein